MTSGESFIRQGWAVVLALAALLCLAAIAPASALAGSVSGTVTDAVTSEGIEEVEVCAWWIFEEGEEGEEDWGCVLSDSDGSYEIPNLDPHNYIVEFWDPLAEYATQFFDHRPFFWEADPVSVGTEAVTGIDGELDLAGAVQGTVRSAGTGAGLEEIEVCAWEVELEAGRCTFTDPAGNYALRRLIAGNYKVEFWPYEPFQIQFWNHKASWSEADEIALAVGKTVAGINGDLLGGPAPPPAVVTPPTITPPVVKPKPKRCRKGFRKKKVKGKVRCVKVRKHRKHRGQKSRSRAIAHRVGR